MRGKRYTKRSSILTNLIQQTIVLFKKMERFKIYNLSRTHQIKNIPSGNFIQPKLLEFSLNIGGSKMEEDPGKSLMIGASFNNKPKINQNLMTWPLNDVRLASRLPRTKTFCKQELFTL